jgi:hypothetical protein
MLCIGCIGKDGQILDYKDSRYEGIQ